MKNAKRILFIAAVMLAGSLWAQDSTNSVDLKQLAIQAVAMSRPDLAAKVEQYKTLIAEKMSEINALKEQLKGFSWKEMLGEKAKAVKEQIGTKTTELTSLKDILGVYTNALNSAQ